MPTRTRRAILFLSLLAALLAACGGAGPGAATDAAPISPSAADPGNAGGNKRLTVMSWNLYLGAELGPVMAATSEAELVAAATAAWAMVVKNDFRVRAAALADQIASARPELIGLQEAYTWRLGESPDSMVVVYDYVQTLLDELAARGLRYRVAARTTLTDLQAPILVSVDPLVTASVRGTDSEVILARGDVRTANPEAHVFPSEHLLQLSVLGQPLEVKRGWASVDVKHQGVSLHLVSTHLEAFHPGLRALQAQDLATALDDEAGTRPVVLVGDLNSDPLDDVAANRDAYLAIAGAGFEDAWLSWLSVDPEPPPDDPAGFTSPYPEDLTVPEIALDERIDFVMLRGALTPQAMAVLGTDISDRVCGVNLAGVEVCLWPSDHAGVRATLRLEDPRFLALAR